MAMDVAGDHPCPHCPTEVTHERHDADNNIALAAECDVVDAYGVESRPAHGKSGESSAEPVAFASTDIAGVIDAPGGTNRPAIPDRIDGAVGPPLHLINCVFLD